MSYVNVTILSLVNAYLEMPPATSHVNTTSHLVAMPRFVSWKSVFQREALAFDTRNTAWHHACKSEVIIERYCMIHNVNVKILYYSVIYH